MAQKGSNSRKEQGAQTKKRLYECAERLFRESDYTDVSVEDITKAAGVCKGAFYVHFASKDALIGELIAHNVAHTDAGYRAFKDSLPPDMSACDKILALSERIAEVMTKTIGPDNSCMVYRLMLEKDVDMGALKSDDREVYTLYRELIAEGIERGELYSVLPPEVLSRYFVTAYRGAGYEWCTRYPEVDLKEQAVAMMRLLLEGIKA